MDSDNDAAEVDRLIRQLKAAVPSTGGHIKFSKIPGPGDWFIDGDSTGFMRLGLLLMTYGASGRGNPEAKVKTS